MGKIIQKTNGKKTESLGVLMILFQALLLIKPEMLDPNMEKAITIVIGSGIIPTLVHRAWRNRSDIKDFIINLFKKN